MIEAVKTAVLDGWWGENKTWFGDCHVKSKQISLLSLLAYLET
jgi:hypothetical protein